MNSSKQRREPWRANERHYCAICNSWMGSDRQSIMIHENGKKHREKLEENLKQRRLDKIREEKEQNYLASSLKKMEEMAAAAHSRDIGSSSSFSNMASGKGPVRSSTAQQQGLSGIVGSCVSQLPLHDAVKHSSMGTHSASIQKSNLSLVTKSSEIESWQDRKKKREDGKNASGDEYQEGINESKVKTNLYRKLDPNEGHYTIDGSTYLEGHNYAPIFEEDMVVQIWTGSATMTEEYKKCSEAQSLWKTGILIKIQKQEQPTSLDNIEGATFVFNVSYLNNPDDEDEIIEKGVNPERIRLVLGADDIVPGTIEEARLALMGGEETVTINENVSAEIDENTGLSSWGTVAVRKVTVNHEIKEERARIRAQKREEAERERMKEKEAEERKMEEAKHANADDSALGAYDVWSSGKGGYKGVKIDVEGKLDVVDTAKSLSKGKINVVFKKRGVKKKGAPLFTKAKKQIRRTVLSDDDE